MKVICKGCNTTYNISDDKIPLKTKIAKCKKCNTDIRILGKEDISKLSKPTPPLKKEEVVEVTTPIPESPKPIVINSNISLEEKTLHKAGAHYFIFLPSIMSILFGFFLISLKGIIIYSLGLVLAIFGIIDFIRAIITKLSVELIVTSKRVTIKKGLVRKNIIEFDHAKIENFSIEQSFLGKILDYGNITINGIGVGKTLVENIQSPASLCRKIVEEIEHSQNNAPNVFLNITLIPSFSFLNNISEKKQVAFLAFSLGWLGVHNFYLNKKLFGFFYLGISMISFAKEELNNLIIIPLLFAIMEGLYYFFMSDKAFEETVKSAQKNSNMNMMTCPECKKEISKKAKQCPHCGFGIQKNKRGFLGSIVLLLFILVTLMLVLIITGSNNGQNLPSNANSLAGTWLVLLFLTLLTRPKN